ncbi:MAG: DUF2911 domain-containing protein [Acidobacteriaceae bacterium]
MRNPARCTVLALALTVAAALGASAPASAQMGNMSMPAKSSKPMLSPAAMTDVDLGGTHITIHYNSPRMRGRKIMGGLVPYGKPWRTGANPATSLVTTGDLKIGDLTVPAGSYTLFTLPEAPGTPWKLIVSKKTGEWGIPYPEGADFGRTPMREANLPAPQEDMSISFEHTKDHSTELHVKWDTTDEYVKIEAVK